MYTKCVERNHEAILNYFYYNPMDEQELPSWIESTIKTEDEDMIVTIAGLEPLTVSLGGIIVYDETNNSASVMEMNEFIDSYQRVED